MIIVIKVGTQSILSSEGAPFEDVIAGLVDQLVTLKRAGHQVLLVSSGAVGSGRRVAFQVLGRTCGSSIAEKQVLASLGQPELMQLYSPLFKSHHMLPAQLLLTKQDFQTRQHYLNVSRLLHELTKHEHIIPVINENDSVAIHELMFTDNDELAGLVAAQMNADKLIILTNVEGVYTGNPTDPSSKLIPMIDPKKSWPEVSALKSAQGRGGMESKLATARKMSNLGITTHIANMGTGQVITRLIAGEELGTTILPAKKKSNIKKWMAFNSDKKTGSISVNTCLFEILTEKERVISILPVGIDKCEGNFNTGDLVEILNSQGNAIGIGVAKYDVAKLNECLGQKDKPEFIHCDYLHIF
jgi:glutamate 5-kinase